VVQRRAIYCSLDIVFELIDSFSGSIKRKSPQITQIDLGENETGGYNPTVSKERKNEIAIYESSLQKIFNKNHTYDT